MKAQVIHYLVPTSVKFTGRQLQLIHRAWQENWDIDSPFDTMSCEDILITAMDLGFIEELPLGWAAP